MRTAAEPGGRRATGRRWLRRAVLLVVGLVLGAGGWLLVQLHRRPDLAVHGVRELPAGVAGPDRLTATFLGVSTVLFDDGETQLLTDGFFSRPSLLATAAGRISPDRERIAAALQRADVERLAAVLVVHSHYDHAMDAPEVARRTGALLVGSPSTANVARGWALPERRIQVATPDAPLRFGRFTVTFIPSRHLPHGVAMGEIEAPLVPPARATEYREGGSYSLLVEHPLGRVLVQGSAGWAEGALAGRRADVVLLGIGGMGSFGEAYMADYWREVVAPLGARCVIPTHYDDFTRPLGERIEPMPALVDDVGASFAFLTERARADGLALATLPPWQPVVLLGPEGPCP